MVLYSKPSYNELSYKKTPEYFSAVICISLSLYFVFLSAFLESPIPFPENGAKFQDS